MNKFPAQFNGYQYKTLITVQKSYVRWVDSMQNDKISTKLEQIIPQITSMWNDHES